MSFWDQAGKVFLQSRMAAAQNKDTMQRLSLHGFNQGQQLHLQHVAQGLGIDPATQPFLKPYGVEPDMNVTNNYTPPALPAPTTPAPSSGSGLLKGIGVAALMGTGVGAAGVGGYYAINQALSNLPAKVAPAPVVPVNLDIKWHNEPDKGGMVFDEVKPK
jgi:hypothetical protein